MRLPPILRRVTSKHCFPTPMSQPLAIDAPVIAKYLEFSQTSYIALIKEKSLSWHKISTLSGGPRLFSRDSHDRGQFTGGRVSHCRKQKYVHLSEFERI